MDKEEKLYKIQITGLGYSISDDITKTQVANILSIIAMGTINATINLPTSNSNTKNYSKRRPNSGNFSPVQVREELAALSLEPVSPLYGSYWAGNKSKALRLLWILAALNEKSIENINQSELELIAKKMGDNIPKKSITALLDPHKKASRIAPGMEGSTRTIRILKPGLDYIKELSSMK